MTFTMHHSLLLLWQVPIVNLYFNNPSSKSLWFCLRYKQHKIFSKAEGSFTHFNVLFKIAEHKNYLSCKNCSILRLFPCCDRPTNLCISIKTNVYIYKINKTIHFISTSHKISIRGKRSSDAKNWCSATTSIVLEMASSFIVKNKKNNNPTKIFKLPYTQMFDQILIFPLILLHILGST